MHFYRDTTIWFDICGKRNVMSINSESKGQAIHSTTENSLINVLYQKL